MKKLLTILGAFGLTTVAAANVVAYTNNFEEAEVDLGTIIFLDSNHEVINDQNVSESEAALATEAITNLIKLEIDDKIPGAKLGQDYEIDSSQIHPGDLSRGAEVLIQAKQGSTLIKEGTYTSAWVLFINADTRFDLGTITFLDSNYGVWNNTKVSVDEANGATKEITNLLKKAMKDWIPDVQIDKDYEIDASQIYPGDLSRGAEIFLKAKLGSTLIKEDTYTSAWVLFINE